MKNLSRPAAGRGLPVLLAAVSAVALAAPARADVRLPKVFSDHMVLQRDAAVPVWGWADPGEEVTVAVAGQTKKTTAGADGKWAVRLGKLEGAGPLTLTVKGKNERTVRDVLVGEVWLASGQSNMALTVKQARDFAKEKEAAHFPQIRMFTVARHPAREPQADCDGSWQVCSPETVGDFSATAYFFGRDLHQKLNVPVGLINSSYGGTPIEAWTSRGVMAKQPELKALLNLWAHKAAEYDPEEAKARYEEQLAKWKEAAARAKAEGKAPPRPPRKPVRPQDDPHAPAVLFNGMIAPLIPYALRGAIWYQGESNAGSEQSGKLYGVQLPLLVRDWRGRWGEGDFPFAWVQLPNFETQAKGWPFVREAMLHALALPNTGMAVAIDIGEAHDIHPKNKQEVGRRLALWVRAEGYGERLPWSGPLPAEHKVVGDRVEV
ncbi:MAG TPA: sialate O-acetylesterase, partial [Gemmataceae bacterium]|nr:sialate O-acetylesterase [Gemmataceae bacterium]